MKKVFSKDNEELGLVIRIERLPHLLTKKLVPHIIVERKIGWRKKIHLPFDVEKISEVTDAEVILSINKEQFDAELERQKVILNNRENYRDFVSVTSKWFQTSVTDRRPRRKE